MERPSNKSIAGGIRAKVCDVVNCQFAAERGGNMRLGGSKVRTNAQDRKEEGNVSNTNTFLGARQRSHRHMGEVAATI
jgi:hypothetical protein